MNANPVSITSSLNAIFIFADLSKNQMTNLKRWKKTYWALLVGFHLILLLLISVGKVQIGKGDPAQRVLTSYSYDWTSRVFSGKSLIETWPSGQFLLQNLLVRGLLYLDLDYETQLRIISAFSVLCSFAGIYLLSLVSAKLFGEKAKYLTGFMLLSYATLVDLAGSAYAEIYSFCFIAIALWLITTNPKNIFGKFLLISLAGLSLFIANGMRHEVFFLTIGLVIYFLISKKIWQGIALGFFGGSFFSIKTLYSRFIATEPVTFLNFHTYNYQPDSSIGYNLYKQMIFFIFPEGLVLFLLILLVFKINHRLPLSALNSVLKKSFLILIIPLSTFSLFLFYAILSGHAIALDRYTFLQTSILIVIVCGLIARQDVFDKTVNKIHELLYFTLPPLSLILLAYYYILPIYEPNFTHRKHIPEIGQAIEWLGINTSQDRTLTIDRIGWWEQPLLLYSGFIPGQPSNSYCDTFRPKLSHVPPDSIIDPLRNETNNRLRVFESHWHIVEYQSQFVLIDSRGFDIKNPDFKQSFRDDSHFIKFLKPGVGGGWKLISPYLDEPLSLEVVFNNKVVTILKVLSFQNQ